MNGLNDAIFNENILKEEIELTETEEEKDSKIKKGFSIFNMNVIKKWLADDKDFNDFE